MRRWLARHPHAYWVVIVLLAWLAGTSLTAHSEALDATRMALGETVDVWVAAADTERGDTVVAEQRAIPIAFVPDTALTDLGPDTVARQSIAVGEVIVGNDVAADSPHLVPGGWLIVAIIESPPTGAARGDAVQVASGGLVIADEAIVIEVGSDRTLVAVPADVGALVATANQSNDIALLRVIAS